MLGGTLDVDGDGIPFFLRLLKRLHLRADHVTLHIMGLTLADALHEDFLAELEVDKVDLDGGRAVGGDAHDVAVLLLQCGTGDHDAGGWVEAVGVGGGEGFNGGFAEGDQPVPAVFVGERDAVAHLFFVGFGVILYRCDC